MTSLQAQFDIV